MAYSNASESNSLNLLEAFRVFLEANGWTTNRNVLTTNRRELSVNRGTMYVNIAAENGVTDFYYMLGYGSTGYDSGQSWLTQPGRKTNPLDLTMGHLTGCSFASGSMTYHFFAHNSGDDIKCVVESPVGVFSYLSFGVVNKIGSWTGGNYYLGSRSFTSHFSNTNAPYSLMFPQTVGADNINKIAGGAVYINGIDSNTGWALSGYNANRTVNTERWIFDEMNRDIGRARWRSLVNTLNQRAILIPITIYLNRQNSTQFGASIKFSPLCYIPNMFYTNIKNMSNSQQFTLGGVNYRVFPLFRRADNNFATGWIGVAPFNSGWAAVAIKE